MESNDLLMRIWYHTIGCSKNATILNFKIISSSSSYTLSQGYFFIVRSDMIFSYTLFKMFICHHILLLQLAIFSQDVLTIFLHKFLTVAGNNWVWKRDEIILTTLSIMIIQPTATLVLHMDFHHLHHSSCNHIHRRHLCHHHHHHQHHHHHHHDSSDHILCWCGDLEAANQASSQLIILLPISSLHYYHHHHHH